MANTDLKRTLVVEDEPGIRQVCLRVFTDEGFEVDVAVNGRDALDMLGEKDYDFFLIDVRIPVMSGKELYQCIINLYPKLADRVVFTTGDVIDSYTQRFLELTERPFLLKPFSPDELRTIVRETLRRMANVRARTKER